MRAASLYARSLLEASLDPPLFTTQSKGKGFGLAVVKRMTEALGGTVRFESEIGKGTTFFLEFPQKRQQNVAG